MEFPGKVQMKRSDAFSKWDGTKVVASGVFFPSRHYSLSLSLSVPDPDGAGHLCQRDQL